MEFELIVREGQQSGRKFTVLEKERKTIGRAPDCEIRLADQGVSRHHCRIEHLADGLKIFDLQSANGTYINGELVETGVLAPGDQLAVGPTILECQVKAPPPAPRAGGRAVPGEATLSIREGGSTTVLRKIVDTQHPGMLAAPDATPTPTALERAQKNLATAYQVSKMLANARDLEDLFDGVIESVFKSIQADRAALLLENDGETGDLDVVAARTRRSKDDPGEISVSRTVVKDVLENGVSTLSQDATADARYREGQSIIQQKIRAVMCAPLATDDRILGVLYADSRSLAGVFEEPDLELLALIGNQAGVAIHRAQLIGELEQFFFDTIRAMVATIDAKDGYTHRHSERVAGFAVRIARELGRSTEELEVVQLSGLLHDVGKIGVPERILNKPGKLTDDEFEEIKKHPVHGVRILGHIKNPRIERIVPGVRHHHEKWDGSGYPDGLAGAEIPWLGRLLAVADVLDALTSDRSYREAFTLDKTVSIILQDAGTHFDRELAEAAGALHERGELEVPLEEWLDPVSASEEPAPTARL